MLVCSSPKLFAAYHVLHRLSVPRHPSCALSSLTTKKHKFVYLSLNISCCANGILHPVRSFFLLADFRALYVLYRMGRRGAIHAGDGDGTAEIRCACDDGDIVDALVHRAFAFDVDAGAEFLSERGK